eukprot:11591877-Prorocentrum_lima.AAC.1
MTSSLVGSEMCIRDSVSNNSASGIRDANFLGGSGVPRGVEGPATRNNEPVSYTHLTLPTICSV